MVGWKFCSQNFRGSSWPKKVPKGNREYNLFCKILASPCCASDAAWRPLRCKNFRAQVFREPCLEAEGSEDNPATTKCPRRTANTSYFAKFRVPRVACETLRGAHGRPKIPCPKISRTKLDGKDSEERPRIQPMLQKFYSPALSFKRCVAPIPARKFRYRKLTRTALWKKGSVAATQRYSCGHRKVLPQFETPLFAIDMLHGKDPLKEVMTTPSFAKLPPLVFLWVTKQKIVDVIREG